jgi:hypothetical protein
MLILFSCFLSSNHPYLCFINIKKCEKCDLHKSGWFIHHPDQIFEEILNLTTTIYNSACGTCYSHIYVSATFWQNMTSSNQDDLYIILTRFLRWFWISNQKFQIQPVASAIAIFVFQPHFRKMWPHPMRMVYISFWSKSWGGSEFEVINIKFHE